MTSGSPTTAPVSPLQPSEQKLRRIAVVGNPNTGKTSLFNALTGFRRHVANYPGVTVEVAQGPVRGTRQRMELVDLPGSYSLAAGSPDEALVIDTLSGAGPAEFRPDVLLIVVDASNIARNLFFVSQLLEFNYPTIIALNMTDVAESRGLMVKPELLSERLGVPVVPVVAKREETVQPLIKALEQDLAVGRERDLPELPEAITSEARAFATQAEYPLPPVEAVRLLLYENGHAEQRYRECGGNVAALTAARERLREAGITSPLPEVQSRYAWVNRVLDGVLTRPDKPVETWSDRFDRILTNRFTGAIILAAVLFTMFTAIFSWATPVMDLVEWTVGEQLGGFVAGVMPEGVVRSFVVDGLIAGVGGVLVFLPQILILFAFIAILEDCGYLARAAYMMDRLMRFVGLSGRAFIPLLSSFACAVPAIMGTRTIGDKRERYITILIAPFMSCSARLPVYVLLIAAIVPPTTYAGGWLGLQPLVMMAMYTVGVVVAILIAWILRKSVFAGPSGGFVMEMPTYKLPRLRSVWQRMYNAGTAFLWRAGTVILLVNVVVWALAYFPRSETVHAEVAAQAAAEGWDEAKFEEQLEGAYLRTSFLGRAGQAIEPLVEPMGWDWRIGVGVIASFPAREVIIATLGTIFNLGAEQDEASEPLRETIRNATHAGTGEALFTLPVALSIMVFFALCAQCGATLATIGKETNSVRWPVISFVGMTVIAYFAAWGTAAAARAAGL
jgi:ferrous iron transport protein B